MVSEGNTASFITPETITNAAQELSTETVEETEEEPRETQLSLDVAFDIVKNERRRLVLKYLSDHDGPVSLGDLAEYIAAIENDKEERALNSSERKRVYIGLYQCHLPKMDAAGVITSERNSNITLGENADQVLQYVDVEPDETRPWNRYYLSLSGMGLLLFLVSGLVASGISTMLLGVFVVSLLGMSVAHTATERQR